MKARPRVFSVGPWHPDEGDPASPSRVLGIAVIRGLEEREDRPGALVRLEDGRYALTGKTFAVGTATAVRNFARLRAHRAEEGERRWLNVVIKALRE